MNTHMKTEKKQGVFSKIALSIALLFAAVAAVGCGGGAGSSVAVAPSEQSAMAAAAKWTSSDITYDIKLVSSSFDAANNATTFVYHVVSNPNGGPAISHWMLLIQNECNNPISIVSSSDATAGYGRDGSTDYTGLKFDTGYRDKEARDVAVVLAGRWGVGDMQILVKSGNGFVIGSAQGPVCSAAPVEHVISGMAFLDVAKNNVRDADEPPVDSVRVVLHDENGNVHAEARSDNSGAYSFTAPAGVYSVSFDVPSGMIPSGPTSLPVDIRDADAENNNLGLSVDISFIATQTANGFTIGYWKNNLRKAIDGTTKGIQVNAATLNSYVASISVFGLAPLNVSSLSQAYSILNSNGSDPAVLLSKQLMGSEFNYASRAFIGGDERLTRMFLMIGEYMLAHPEMFSSSKMLEAQKWYDAYNNSHGSLIVL